jgi:ADP-ribosylglycohydrolase
MAKDLLDAVYGCLIGGAIGDALGAPSAIRQNWISQCEKANRDFFEEVEGDPEANFRSMAERMADILRSERHRTSERARLLDRLLRTG